MIGIVCILGNVSCSDPAFAPPIDTGKIYWNLRVNYPAVRLSLRPPYDTLQLSAVPYNADRKVWRNDDVPVEGIGTVLWSSSDPSKVSVSETGFLKARDEASKVWVYASQQIDGITHMDTVWVQVKDEEHPQVPHTLSIHPLDSLKRAMNVQFTLPTTVLDANGDTIHDMPVKIITTAQDALFNIQGFNTPYSLFTATSKPVGGVKFLGATWAEGVSLWDSVTIQVGWTLVWQATGTVRVGQVINKDGVVEYALLAGFSEMGPGGEVRFQNVTSAKPAGWLGDSPLSPISDLSIIFDDSTIALPAVSNPAFNSGGGNIHDLPGDLGAFRRFVRPGTYQYTVQPLGFRGVLVVHDR